MLCGNEYGTAHFKGIEFQILPSTHSGGRRVIVNEYPFSDKHYNEDMGDKPQKFSVKGCFHGKDFRKKLWQAQRVWNKEGDGIFYEPTQNKKHWVRLLTWSFSYHHKKINYVEFSLELVETGNNPYTANDDPNDLTEDYINQANDNYTDIINGG